MSLTKIRDTNTQLFSHFLNGSTSGFYSYNVGKFLKTRLILLHPVCRCILELMRNKKMKFTRVVRKVKNVWAYNPRSCFIVPDQKFGVFSRV